MTKKILIIDDEPDFRTYLATIFTENGHEAIQGRDGPEGLELASREQPDMITLDVLMPDQSGIKVYRELRNSGHSRSDIVAFTNAVLELVTSELRDAQEAAE